MEIRFVLFQAACLLLLWRRRDLVPRFFFLGFGLEVSSVPVLLLVSSEKAGVSTRRSMAESWWLKAPVSSLARLAWSDAEYWSGSGARNVS